MSASPKRRMSAATARPQCSRNAAAAASEAAFSSTNGRTSMDPCRAVGICPAASMAASIHSHSTTK